MTLESEMAAGTSEVLTSDLRQGRLTFRFKQPFERQYCESAFRQARSFMRLSCFILLFILASLATIVFIQIPEMIRSPLAVTGAGISCVYSLAGIALSFRKNFGKRYETVVICGISLNTFALIAMALPFPSEWIRTSFGGIILLLVAPMLYRIRLGFFIPMQLAVAASWSIFLVAKNAYPTVTGRPIAALLFVFGALLVAIASSAIIEGLSRRDFAAKIALDREREKSETLIRNVMPNDIAERLKAGEKVIGDHFDSVSILFADLSGFTAMASEASPRQLVELLNDIFGRFDDLADQYGLEKIKTMGDAYMAVAGVGGQTLGHAQTAADFGLAIFGALDSFNSANGTGLNMKIGIHSGPVIAGVIGKKKYAYDIWGDAVNIASRMESQGLPGQIQISEGTYRLLESTHVCRFRGAQDIKGKGPLDTWFVDRRL